MKKVNQIRKLKIDHINTRSFFAHFDEVFSLILENDFDITCLSETWLNGISPIKVFMYLILFFFRCDRKHRGAGVGIYVKTHFNCQVIHTNFNAQYNSMENIWLKVEIRQQQNLIGIVCRTP